MNIEREDYVADGEERRAFTMIYARPTASAMNPKLHSAAPAMSPEILRSNCLSS